MPNYDTYSMTKVEKVKHFTIAYVFIFLISYLFYANIAISLLFSCSAYFYLEIKKKQIILKRKRQLLLEFKDAIYLLSTSFSSGYSVENAFKKTLEALIDLYQGQESLIVKELETIVQQIGLNKSTNALLLSFSKRAGIDDITNFVDVFITCENTGGNLNEVIKTTSTIINEKIEIEEEIGVLVTQKKIEQKVISIIPICIMFILSLTASDYLEPLHNSFEGYVVVTIALIMIFTASIVARKIMDIKV
ncbi:MAG TPA: pilus assembly protein TadB [Clostridiales bacterium]|nr:MAG: hypothetical protein A2Y18_06355 [Clostridiales bacterium GWD2_32_19]HCC07671.1 pilus assembly protein TadB [Clostridiales bacterium]